MTPTPDAAEARTLALVHLFPDLLSTYGDGGNLRALVVRAERRGIRVTLLRVLEDSVRVPDGDVFVIGGGQDRDQLRVEQALGRLGAVLERKLDAGAALLAVCGGYQSLGRRYRFADGRTVHGPGIFPIETIAADDRLVGPVVARLDAGLMAGADPVAPRATVVGFENHSGRTVLDGAATPFAIVEVGSGNNGNDRTEGTVACGAGVAPRGLRIGTYLHGPLLPRNPHVADLLLRAGLARSGQAMELAPLDDGDEWRAHDDFVRRTTRRTGLDRLPGIPGEAIQLVRTAMRR